MQLLSFRPTQWVTGSREGSDIRMATFNLNAWLRKTPQPVAVLADDRRIELPKNGRAWRDLTETVAALNPSQLTCLDKDGNIIRSKQLRDDDAGEPESAKSEIEVFANLIAGAYEKGAVNQQPLLQNAFEFIERQGQRLVVSEREIDRLKEVNTKLRNDINELRLAAQGGGDGDDGGGIVGAFVQAIAMKEQQQQAAPPPLRGVANAKKDGGK